MPYSVGPHSDIDVSSARVVERENGAPMVLIIRSGLGSAPVCDSDEAQDRDALAGTTSEHTAAPVDKGSIEREGAPRLFVRRASAGPDAPVIIVVNGGPGKSHDHLVVLERLADEGWTVVTYDQRGTGHSGEPAEVAGYAFSEQAADLDAVRRWTGAERVALLGHSWGGPVIFDYATRYSSHVLGLLVVASGPVVAADLRLARYPPPPDPMPPVREGLDLSCVGWWPSMVNYYPNPTDFRPEHLAGTCHPTVNSRVWQANRDYNLVEAMGQLQMPVLVWFGEQDPLMVHQQRILNALVAAEVTDTVVPECGHRPMFQCPERFYSDVGAFLGELTD